MKTPAFLLLSFTLALASPAMTQGIGQGIGVANGITSVASQLGGKLFNRDKRHDIEAERTKLFESFETQSAGMDEDAHNRMRATLEQKWALAENQMLTANAQAAQRNRGPLINFKQVALDVAGGAAMQANFGLTALGDGGMTGVLQSSVMNGVLVGAGGSDTGITGALAYSGANPMSSSLTDVATNAVTSTAANKAGETVSGTVAEKTRSFFNRGKKEGVEITKFMHPLEFFDEHPSKLLAKDLYRENGFEGYKQIESTDRAQAYAPVAGDKNVKAVVFTNDESGAITAAFRVLKAGLEHFSTMVELAAMQLDEEPRFASEGAAMRAVWESGAFLAADAQQVSYGWSANVPSLYGKAGATSVIGTQE